MKKTKNLGMCGDCESMEKIEGVGMGCVSKLSASAPWAEEWKRIKNTVQNCNRHSLAREEHYANR